MLIKQKIEANGLRSAFCVPGCCYWCPTATAATPSAVYPPSTPPTATSLRNSSSTSRGSSATAASRRTAATATTSAVPSGGTAGRSRGTIGSTEAHRRRK